MGDDAVRLWCGRRFAAPGTAHGSLASTGLINGFPSGFSDEAGPRARTGVMVRARSLFPALNQSAFPWEVCLTSVGQANHTGGEVPPSDAQTQERSLVLGLTDPQSLPRAGGGLALRTHSALGRSPTSPSIRPGVKAAGQAAIVRHVGLSGRCRRKADPGRALLREAVTARRWDMHCWRGNSRLDPGLDALESGSDPEAFARDHFPWLFGNGMPARFEVADIRRLLR